jgi:hypothetical protein
MFSVKFLFLIFPTISALYSIHYYAPSEHAGVVGDEVEFSRTPTAMQVADIFARVAGRAPLLHEGTFWFYDF